MTEMTTLQHAAPVTAEDVVIQAQQIAALVHLGTLLKATETPVQLHVIARIQQQPAVFINSELIRDVLMAEFNKLGELLTNSGVDLESLMKAEHQRFEQLYKQQSN